MRAYSVCVLIGVGRGEREREREKAVRWLTADASAPPRRSSFPLGYNGSGHTLAAHRVRLHAAYPFTPPDNVVDCMGGLFTGGKDAPHIQTLNFPPGESYILGDTYCKELKAPGACTTPQVPRIRKSQTSRRRRRARRRGGGGKKKRMARPMHYNLVSWHTTATDHSAAAM